MKHITDRYNMYYSFAPTKLNEQIHMAAVNQAMFAPLLGLFWMLFFSILRLGRSQAHLCLPPLLHNLPVTALLEQKRCCSLSVAKPSGFFRPQGLVLETRQTFEGKGRTWPAL